MQIDFGKYLTDAAKEAGIELKATSAEATEYLNGRVAVLSTLEGQPGFDEAVKAEALAGAIHLAVDTVDEADANDARFVRVVFGLLTAATAMA